MEGFGALGDRLLFHSPHLRVWSEDLQFTAYVRKQRLCKHSCCSSSRVCFCFLPMDEYSIISFPLLFPILGKRSYYSARMGYSLAHVNDRNGLIIMCVFFSILSTGAVALRFYSRKFKGLRYQADDWLAFGGLVWQLPLNLQCQRRKTTEDLTFDRCLYSA